MFALGREDLLASVVLFSLVLSVASGAVATGWEVDETAFVSRVVDGDTLHATRLGVVRLADIDTPEVGEPGAQEATDYLTSLVHGRQVYLDVDDLERTDRLWAHRCHRVCASQRDSLLERESGAHRGWVGSA